jgi:hypothetical protein
VKLGESRRTLYGVVGFQASKTQASLLCLVVVLPISVNGAVSCVYSQRCMQTSGLANNFAWSWSWNRDFVLGAQSRLGRSGLSTSFSSIDIWRYGQASAANRGARERNKHAVVSRSDRAVLGRTHNMGELWVPPGGGAISISVRSATCLLNLAHSNSSGSFERSQDEVHFASVGPFGCRQCGSLLQGAI